MNWKYEAIEKLTRYSAKKNALATIPEEIRRLEQAMSAIRSSTSDGTPVKGGGSGREDMLLGNIVKRQELARSLVMVESWLSPVEKALAQLSEEERLVLELFYIQPFKGSVDRLCQELCCEKSAVYDRRAKALYHFTVAMYGNEET